MFAWLILVPDLSMLGYFIGPRWGARLYNAGHTYLSPAVAWLALHLTAPAYALPIALIWAVHIGVDRLLGFGLKYETGFRDTHIGRV